MFWKGWGSVCICKGAAILTEVGVCELLHVPRYDSILNFKCIFVTFFHMNELISKSADKFRMYM